LSKSNKNHCLSWADTCEWFDLLGIHSPPVLYRGVWDEAAIRAIQVGAEAKAMSYV